MENKLSKKNSEDLVQFCKYTTNNFKSVDQYIQQAEKVTNVTINCGSDFTIDEVLQDGHLPRATSNQFYNLIVLERHGVLEKDKFAIKAELVLDHTEDSIRKRLLCFDEQAKNEIKSYPTMICKLEGTEVEYGNLTHLELKDGMLDFAFWKIPVPSLTKSALLEIHQDLKIGCVTDRNELQEPHWAVKEADLVHILNDHGYEVPVISF